MDLKVLFFATFVAIFAIAECVRIRPVQKSYYKGVLSRYRPYRVNPYMRSRFLRHGNVFSRHPHAGRYFRSPFSQLLPRRIVPRKPRYYGVKSNNFGAMRPVALSNLNRRKMSYPQQQTIFQKPVYYQPKKPSSPKCTAHTIFMCRKSSLEYSTGKCLTVCKYGKSCTVPCRCSCVKKAQSYKPKQLMLLLPTPKPNIPVCHKKEVLRCTALPYYAATDNGCIHACGEGFCAIGCQCTCRYNIAIAHEINGGGPDFDHLSLGAGGLSLGGAFGGGNIGGGVLHRGIGIGSHDGGNSGGDHGKIKEENIEVKIDVTSPDAGQGQGQGDATFLGGANGLGLGSIGMEGLADLGLAGPGGLDLNAIPGDLLSGLDLGNGGSDPILLLDPTQPSGGSSNIPIIPGSGTTGIDSLGLFPEMSNAFENGGIGPDGVDALGGIPVGALGATGPALDAFPSIDAFGAAGMADIGLGGVGGGGGAVGVDVKHGGTAGGGHGSGHGGAGGHGQGGGIAGDIGAGVGGMGMDAGHGNGHGNGAGHVIDQGHGGGIGAGHGAGVGGGGHGMEAAHGGGGAHGIDLGGVAGGDHGAGAHGMDFGGVGGGHGENLGGVGGGHGTDLGGVGGGHGTDFGGVGGGHGTDFGGVGGGHGIDLGGVGGGHGADLGVIGSVGHGGGSHGAGFGGVGGGHGVDLGVDLGGGNGGHGGGAHGADFGGVGGGHGVDLGVDLGGGNGGHGGGAHGADFGGVGGGHGVDIGGIGGGGHGLDHGGAHGGGNNGGHGGAGAHGDLGAGLGGGHVELLDPSLSSVLPVALSKGKQPDRDKECRRMKRRLWCEVRKSWNGTPGLLKWCNVNCVKGNCDIERCQCDCVNTSNYHNLIRTL